MPLKTSRILTLLLLAGVLSTARSLAAPPFEEWGTESLQAIRKDLWLPKLNLYAEQAPDEKGVPAAPAFMWGVGVQLSALAAASKVQPEKYLPETKAYADAINVYWLKHNEIEGFDVQPGPKASDRYYDDNAWLVLALADVFEVSKDQKYLARSAAAFRFVMSGEDDKLGGGLYWREEFRTSKNTCTNAPAIVSALRLYQLTKDDKQLETAKRVYAWTNSHLQDQDGLYWDAINLEGRVNKRKYSYNTALMIRANCLFHAITGEARYLDEAKRVAMAAEKFWVSENGAVSDSGKFAHLLMESLLAVYQQDKDPHWTETVERTLVYVHSNLRSANGRYSAHWSRPANGSLKESMLLNQASPARAFWVAADVIKAP
ncbi:MAG: glycoside hydrolase family 76 protein [Verrucomicrobiota bacterium]